MEKLYEQINAAMAPVLGEFLPKLIGAILFLVIGWFVARIVRWLVRKVATKLDVNRRLGNLFTPEGHPPADLSTGFAKSAFWLIMLFVAIGCLRALGMDQVSAPLTGLLNKFFAFLPNLIGAGVLFAVAWLVASLVRFAARKALQLSDVDRRLNLKQGAISNSIPMALFCLVLLFFLPGVLGALQLAGLTAPVQDMVDQILGFVPSLISGLITMAVFFFVGKLVGTLVANLTRGIGFNKVPAALGFSSDKDPAEWKMQPADLLGKVVFAVVVFLGLSQALETLKLAFLTNVFRELIAFAGPVLAGTVIFAIGLWLANLARNAIHASSDGASSAAGFAYAGILVLAGAVALRRMGLADDIVNMAFGLTLGSLAVAAALAFGIGGRDAAAKFLEKKRMTSKKTPPKRAPAKRRSATRTAAAQA